MSGKLKTVESILNGLCDDLKNVCRLNNAWVFLCMASFIDYLVRLENMGPGVGTPYSDFIRRHFPQGYRDFTYKCGTADLPEQMFHVMRNGLVHAFSLVPDSRSAKGSGRERSIVLAHAGEAAASGWRHLQPYTNHDNGISDAALFVAENFLDDMRVAVVDFLEEAERDGVLQARILRWFEAHPPIRYIAGGIQAR